MLTKIKVYGPLKKFCNNQKYFEAKVQKPIDAISFLKCNFKGLEKHMANQHYCIKVRGKEISEKNLSMKMDGDIQIIPIADGNFFGNPFTSFPFLSIKYKNFSVLNNA